MFKIVILKLLTLIALSFPALHAQPTSRSQEIEQERDKKTALLKPEAVDKPAGFLRNFKDKRYLERFGSGYKGFRPKLGDMVVGSGFAFGPEYFREDIRNGEITLRASAQTSTRGYLKMDTEVTLPRLVNSRINLDLRATYRNYGGIDYYGPGPESAETGRSNYRLEDTTIETVLTLKPSRHIRLGPSLAYLNINVGPGTRTSRFISADKQFPNVPGMNQQTDFLRTGVYAQFDYRDNPLGPKNGGNYVINYSWFNDQKLNQFNFRRLDIDLQQYIGFFNRTRVIALRAKGVFTDTDRGDQVPFYLQPFLGGANDLRGYRNFRFSDRNMILLNAEYRWEIFAGLDGAIFADAGKVSPRRGLTNFKDLESSVGFGFRLNARNSTFMRIDTAFSHEGFRLWFQFNDIFNQRKFGTTTGQPIY